MPPKKILGHFRNAKTTTEELKDVKPVELQNPHMFFFLLHSTIFLSWLRNFNLLRSTYTCPKCKSVCSLNNRASATDKQTFRCLNNKNHEYSIRKDSFFEGIKYTIQDCMVFIYEFMKGSSLKTSAKTAGISYNKTCVDYANFIRDIFTKYVWDILNERYIFDDTVELDESLFGRRIKYNRGKCLKPQVWIFGK